MISFLIRKVDFKFFYVCSRFLILFFCIFCLFKVGSKLELKHPGAFDLGRTSGCSAFFLISRKKGAFFEMTAPQKCTPKGVYFFKN